MVVVDPDITARTERLLIRPLTMADAQDVVLMRQNPKVMEHTYIAPDIHSSLYHHSPCDSSLLPSDDIEQSKKWIQGCHDRDDCWNFVIEPVRMDASAPTQAPRVIGLIGAVRAPEVGYMFNSRYWGQGYATEALRAFMPLFFDHFTDFEYAEALTDPELITSHKVLIKAGFRFVERRDRDFDNPVLGIRDTLVYRMARPAIAADGGTAATNS